MIRSIFLPRVPGNLELDVRHCKFYLVESLSLVVGWSYEGNVHSFQICSLPLSGET